MCRRCWRALPQNKDKEHAQSKKWYQLHRQSEIEKNKEYRKQKRELFDWYHDKDRFGGIKELVLLRDEHMCQSCGKKEKIGVHHLDGTNSIKGNANNGLRNLIVLCCYCHSFLHHQQRRDGFFWSREDIVRTLAKVKEVFQKEHPLRRKRRVHEKYLRLKSKK